MTSVSLWRIFLTPNGVLLHAFGSKPHTAPGNALVGLAGGRGRRFADWCAKGEEVSNDGRWFRVWHAWKPGLAGYVELVASEGMPIETSTHNATEESRSELERGVRLVHYLEECKDRLLDGRGRPGLSDADVQKGADALAYRAEHPLATDIEVADQVGLLDGTDYYDLIDRLALGKATANEKHRLKQVRRLARETLRRREAAAKKLRPKQ